MWESLGKLFSKLSTKSKIITILVITIILVVGFIIAKKIFYGILIISAVIAIVFLINKFKKKWPI